jgi:hypothetical protein
MFVENYFLEKNISFFLLLKDSVLVYEKLQTTTPGVEIDGKAVIAHFSKNNFATS